MKAIISSIFKTFFLSLCVIANTHFAYAQTAASILPPAKTQLLDNNGKPLVSGTVDYYVPGTTTRKTTWQDSGKTVANTNPVVLDGGGRALMLGDGSYRQVVKDRLGNIIWDQVTNSSGSGGGSGSATVGDGQPVGSIQTWAGFVAPSQYAFAYGQEFVRASFPELFAALTSQQNVNCTIGNPTLSGLSSTEQLPIGGKIESSCLNPGSTILSKTVSTVTASSNAIISTTSSARFFPYGNGDGSSTFNVPDLRGLVPAGRDNMGGIAANVLTPTFFANATGLGAVGGGQSLTLNTGNLPPYTPTGTISSFLSSNNAVGQNTVSSSTIAYATGGSSGQFITGTISTANLPISSIFTGSAQGGTSNPFSNVQPTKILNYVIKITPDTNANSFFGVASIGGMQGIISCGFGITCAGNTISAIASVVPAPTPTTLGGVYQSNCTVSRWVTLIDAAGLIGCSQISFSDLAGSIASGQIPSGTITNTQLANGAALSVLGNGTNASASKTDLVGTANQIMRVNGAGTSLGFGSLDLAQSSAVGSSVLSLTNGGCNAALAASNGGILWSNATQCQILAGTANANRPLVSGANTTPAWGTFSLPTTVTSGGVAYFSSTSSMASSAVMTANAFMIGGGAGVAPSAITITGLVVGNGASAPTAYAGVSCTNQFLRALSSTGASTCNTVNLASDITGILPATSHPALTGDVTNTAGSVTTTISNNVVTNAKLAQTGAATLKGNPTNATANATDFTIQGLVNSTTPSATLDYLPIYDSATGTIKRVTPALIASAGVAGVSSFNGRTGAVVPAQGDYPTSLIPGTTTNNNATAGNIGEYVEATLPIGSSVSVTSGTPSNVTSISLTAGDWDVSGTVISNPAGGANQTQLFAWTSTTSATLPTPPAGGIFGSQAAFTTNASAYSPALTNRISLASTTTVYLSGLVTWTTGTNSLYGIIRARRMR